MRSGSGGLSPRLPFHVNNISSPTSLSPRLGTSKLRSNPPSSDQSVAGYLPTLLRKLRRRSGLLGIISLSLFLYTFSGGRSADLFSSAVLDTLTSTFIKSVSGNQNLTDVKPLTILNSDKPGHVYLENGLVVVDPRVGHPIPELMMKARNAWDDKVSSQSKTLEHAVLEYKKRYKRNPPLGFDAWWNYAKENAIVLVDEYDQVHRDLEPFWALDFGDMSHRAKVMQERDHTFTLAIKDGQVTKHGPYKHLRRCSDIADIIQRFAHLIPRPTNLTFIMDDQPAVMISYAMKMRMVEMAHLGERFGPSEYFAEDSGEYSNYARTCPPGAPLRTFEDGEDLHVSLTERSFIYDHVRAMDFCQHPEYKDLHGMTQTSGVSHVPIVPLFTFAKMSIHSDILATPLEQYWDSYTGYDPDFEHKAFSKVMWRGSTTGADFTTTSPWVKSQRSRLHFMSHETSGEQEVLYQDETGRASLVNVTKQTLNKRFMDTSFSGAPAQCDKATCSLLERSVQFENTMGLDEQYKYRYMIDIDGNGWSGRFHRLMSTKSVVLKSTLFPEWYSDRVQPWLHYVPVKIDYSDVYDIMTFFEGMPNGLGSHLDLAERIAAEGRNWAKDHWRRVDMASYMFRLVLEYSRLMWQEDPDIDFAL